MKPLALASVTLRFLAAFPVLLQGQFNFTFTFIKLVKPARHHPNFPCGKGQFKGILRAKGVWNLHACA